MNHVDFSNLQPIAIPAFSVSNVSVNPEFHLSLQNEKLSGPHATCGSVRASVRNAFSLSSNF